MPIWPHRRIGRSRKPGGLSANGPRATGFADLETPDEKRQRQASEHHQAQQVKTTSILCCGASFSLIPAGQSFN